jgi:hypothetical protein
VHFCKDKGRKNLVAGIYTTMYPGLRRTLVLREQQAAFYIFCYLRLWTEKQLLNEELLVLFQLVSVLICLH